MVVDADKKDYINVEDALRRIGGNADLYKRLLTRFIAGDNIEVLEAALLSGNMEESANLVHTLKGVSANLSLIGIRSASIDLEHTLKDGSDFSADLAKLKEVFAKTVEIIIEVTK